MTDTHDPTPDPVDEALFQGNKIEAIKRHRAATDCDLKGAKEAVERRERELRLLDPSRFAHKPSGCLTMLLVAFLGGRAVWAAL